MLEFLHALWRQKSRFFLLLAGIAVGAASICAVGAISQIGSMLCEQELDAMGLSGLIVISADSSIQSDEISRVERQQEVARQTPLACEYAGTGNAQDSSKKKVLLWGIDERTYRTVKITLLHGRLLNDSDAKTDCGMVDKSFAKALYGRENIIGKHIAVRIGDMPVSIEVVGVVDTGGSLTGQLMGSTIPSFLYLPMQTLAMYSGKSGYSQVMITLDKNADPDSAAEHIRSCFSGSVQIQNMTNMRDQLSGILRIFRLVLNALGGVSFVTCGFSVLTVMLQNVREQAKEIGIKKALGATDARIGMEYLAQSFLLSGLGSLIGCAVTAALLAILCSMLHLPTPEQIWKWLWTAIPGAAMGGLYGLYPALLAAKCSPAKSFNA